MSVRVRFAPSPTGFLHVGGLRTALYNYLFAKKNNGRCILRIEDTDRSRLVEKAAENLVENLSWAGVEFDESPFKGGEFGPYVQSERLEIYETYVNDLIDKDWAYYAFDTSEELEEMRKKQTEAKKDPKYDRDSMTNQFTLGAEETKNRLQRGDKYVIRLKAPEKEVRFHDVIRGEIKVHGSDIDDQILLKSDGYPTYHLANVVDDHLMQITHIIRGEEWLPSTPKHVLLYEAFGWDVPEFAHLPLLLNEKKAKLSKRHGDVAVEDFRSKGYLKDAFVNFIALLGWNPSGDREIYDMDDLTSNFNLAKVNKGGAVFNREKLDWMQAQYLKKTPSEPLADMLAPHVKEKGWEGFSLDYLKQVVGLFKERVTFVHEIVENAPYMFEDPDEYEEKYFNKRWKEDSEEIIRPLIDKFIETGDFSHENTHTITKAYVDESGHKFGVVIHPLRLMITGRSVGAGMFETMEVLGKETCIRRMEKFLERIKNDEIQTY